MINKQIVFTNGLEFSKYFENSISLNKNGRLAQLFVELVIEKREF